MSFRPRINLSRRDPRGARRLASPLVLGLLAIGFLASPIEAQTQITGVETTIAGFVGETERGPLGVPTEIRTFGEFLTVFGGDTTGLANPTLAPSVEAFFTNGGGTLFIVRTPDSSDASLIGSVAAGGLAATGLRALAEIDEIALLAVPGLSHTISSAEQELLNPAGVNALRDIAGAGLLLFGGRTIIQIGIAALRPAEFVVFQIVQQRGPPPALPTLRPILLGWLLASLLLAATIHARPGAPREPLRA